jgi:uncharacterized protein YxjI
MSAQFCTKCGRPLLSGSQFCAGCGTPVGGAFGATGGAGPVPSAPPPLFDLTRTSGTTTEARPPDASALRVALGLQGKRSFLLQHEMLSGGRCYRVLDQEKRLLFTARESRSEALSAGLFAAIRLASGRTLAYHWVVADAAGDARGLITVEVTEDGEVSTLSDSTGTPLLAVTIARTVMGGSRVYVVTHGFTATAALPDGRRWLEAKGNLLRHNFSIQNLSGTEVAKIHEAWASVRDTFNLDLVGDVDPLFPLIFAIVIDRGKQEG